MSKIKMTWVMGFQIPRTDIVKKLQAQHIKAVQEYDHKKTDTIELALKSIIRFYNETNKK